MALIFTASSTPSPRGPNADARMAFQTYRGYLEAVCAWATSAYPHPDGMLAGLAGAVRTQRWRAPNAPGGRRLLPRPGQILRNAWATEVLLNAPAALGDGDFLRFANLSAPIHAYYAVFHAISALTRVMSDTPPTDHAMLLRWAAAYAGQPSSPFVAPWTVRVSGCPGEWQHQGFGAAQIDTEMSNLTAAHAGNAASLLALGLRTTRATQIEEHRPSWLKGLPPTRAGTKRKNIPGVDLRRLTIGMRPTTMFDLLWRLRCLSNYKDGDAFLSGPVDATDAAAFHDALCEIVAATLLTVEIFLAHAVGKPALTAEAARVPIPPLLRDRSVLARTDLW